MPRKRQIKKNSASENKSGIDGWLLQTNAKNGFVYDSEIYEINSNDEDSDDANVKNELEKPLRQLLRKKPKQSIQRLFNYECEWEKCNFETNDEKHHVNHILDHMKDLPTTEPRKFVCKWNLCKFDTEDEKLFVRHLDYHAYHTRLKTFGLGLTNVISIPHCQKDSIFRNKIPSIIDEYVCNWSGCDETYLKFREYLEHVNYHLAFDYETGCAAQRNSRENLINIKVVCKWDQCQRTLLNIFELKRHMRIHTNVKMIGCHNCGSLFSSKPLFINHCARQTVNQQSFQCPHCFKFFPSTKLLRDHTFVHVNKFQCNICGLSCQKKSVLARHIRFRHMSEKPFPCDECDYRAKTKNDLQGHKNVHKDKDIYKCEVFQCEYSSKTLMALKRHDAKEHLGQPQIYQCHCCTKKYMRGYLLTQHLKKDHFFKLPPGHSKFIYKYFDGVYKLQTKRVENLKEVQQIVGQKTENVTYEIEKIENEGKDSMINVKFKIVPPAPKDFFAEDSTDINNFEIVKKYKNMKRKNQ